MFTSKRTLTRGVATASLLIVPWFATTAVAGEDARTEAVPPVKFAPKQEYATGGFGGSGWDETSTAVGDFTNDGHPDVVTADLFNPAGTGPILLRNNGDGTLTSPGTRITTTPFTGTVATGDLNNDGNLDLVAGANWGFFVRLGNGDGTFREGEFQYVVQAFQNDIEIGDVNTDGNPDVVVRALHGIVAYLGTGEGTFPQTKTTIFTGGVTPGFSGISLANFDNDGNPDIAASDAVTQRVVTLTGDGQGTFTPLGSGPSAIVPGTILTADFNHDGIDDAAALNEFNTIDASNASAVVLISDGNGGFLPPATYGGGFAPVSGTIGDLNNDGNPDIVSSDVALSKQVVLLGDGHGGFVPGGAYDVGLFPQTPAVGDLNGDHKPDIVTTAVTTGILPGVSGVSVLRNIS